MRIKLNKYWFASIPVPFRLSWGKMGYSRHIFLELENESGVIGHGEGVLYKTTFLQFLPFFRSRFASKGYFETDNSNDFLKFEPALVFALDTATRDMEGKLKLIDQHENITEEIFLDDKIENKIEKFLKRKTKFIKLKVGENINKDKKSIEKINHLSGGKMKIKVDANRGYSFSEAKDMATWGKGNNVILIEEPMKGTFDEISKLRSEIPVPIMLDETVQSTKDLKDAILSDCFDILNIKLTRLGGISNAEKYIAMCEKHGKLISLGCSEELAVGTRAILTLASQVENLYGVEGYGPDRLNIPASDGLQLTHLMETLKNKKGVLFCENNQTSLRFMSHELYGVWSTRLDNLFSLLIK